MQENEAGYIYPVIDEEECIKCGLCKKICPQISKVEMNNPLKAYAAWSSNEEERRTSASGGIGAEIYKYAIDKGYVCIGAAMQNDFEVKLEIADDKEKLNVFKNSKYVFSSGYDVFPLIKKYLEEGRNIVVIALPCQIAAICSQFKKNESLLLVDVVCHGTTPVKYLKEHVQNIENKIGKKANRVLFRDVNKGTENYYFSLYDNFEKCFYAKRTCHGDTYNFGYHRGISYRENCYNCIYATSSRVSDITLSDYKGLGKMAPCDFTANKVSSVLINTKKGQKFIDEIISSDKIIAHERPILEPIKGDPQLNYPSEKNKMRLEFERLLPKKEYSFEKAILPIMKKYFRSEKIRKVKKYLSNVKKKLLLIFYKK